MEEFARCVLGDVPVTEGSSADALGVIELIEAIYREGR